MKKLFLIIAILISAILPAYSQGIEMADALRSNGKIYVVVAVLTIIVVGLFGYLIFLDKKITRMENSIDNR